MNSINVLLLTILYLLVYKVPVHYTFFIYLTLYALLKRNKPYDIHICAFHLGILCPTTPVNIPNTGLSDQNQINRFSPVTSPLMNSGFLSSRFHQEQLDVCIVHLIVKFIRLIISKTTRINSSIFILLEYSAILKSHTDVAKYSK